MKLFNIFFTHTTSNTHNNNLLNLPIQSTLFIPYQPHNKHLIYYN